MTARKPLVIGTGNRVREIEPGDDLRVDDIGTGRIVVRHPSDDTKSISLELPSVGGKLEVYEDPDGTPVLLGAVPSNEGGGTIRRVATRGDLSANDSTLSLRVPVYPIGLDFLLERDGASLPDAYISCASATVPADVSGEGTLTLTTTPQQIGPPISDDSEGLSEWTIRSQNEVWGVRVFCSDAGARTDILAERWSSPAPEISGAFPEWITGLPATGALTISGGVQPYGGLAITAGALPDEVSLSIVGNQIVPSGTPTVAGPWSATVQVSDAVSAPAFITLNGDVVEHTFVYAQWDPAYLTNGGAIVNSGRDLVSKTSVGYRSTRSTIPLSGNVYFSLSADKGAAINYGLGVVDSGTDLVPSSSWVGLGGSAGWWWEGRIYMGGSIIHTAGSTPIVQIAARVATRRFWMRYHGGPWVGGGDPVSDTNPTFVLPGAGAIYAAATLDVTGGFAGALARICAHPDNVTGTTPSGFVRGIFA